MLLLGLGNKARNGKDTIAQAVVDYYPDDMVQRIGFADALYEIARNEYGMTDKNAPLLQKIGHDRRQQDSLYWVKKAFAKIKPEADIVIITDCRYLNEADYIKSKRGYIVNVTRKTKDGKNYIAQDRPADHPSEIELDGYPFDFYLVNTEGHQALLAEQAITLVEYLKGLR